MIKLLSVLYELMANELENIRINILLLPRNFF
jgi:hypothetical protein